MGYIVLALGAVGLVVDNSAQARSVAVTGAVVQMVSHGLITAALFLLAGVILVVLPLMLDGFRLNLVGKYLTYAFVALGLVICWGYAGILSLGQMAFFALGGYMIGMWLMVARTEGIVTGSLANLPIPPTEAEISQAVATQIFGVVGSDRFPAIWALSGSLIGQLALVVLVPGVLALAVATVMPDIADELDGLRPVEGGDVDGAHVLSFQTLRRSLPVLTPSKRPRRASGKAATPPSRIVSVATRRPSRMSSLMPAIASS